MTDEEFFSYTTDLGGFGPRLDVDARGPWARDILTREGLRIRGMIDAACQFYPTLPVIHFDWIENGGINACAFAGKGKYYIGVTYGALFAALILFHKMMADPRILRHIGDPSDEKLQVPSPLSIESLLAEGGRASNPVRLKFAIHLALLFIDFLASHEFHHIKNGHIAYLDDQFGCSLISEIGPSEKNYSTLIRQTLEMDADCGGVCALVDNAQKTASETTRLPPYDVCYGTADNALFTIGLPLFTFFRLFGDKTYVNETLFEKDYPPRTRSRNDRSQHCINTRDEEMGSRSPSNGLGWPDCGHT